MAAGRRSTAAGSGIPVWYGVDCGLSGGSSRYRPGQVAGGELRRQTPCSPSAGIKLENCCREDL